MLPVATSAALAIWRPERRALWILVAVIAAFVGFDFALDETRFDDLPLFRLGLLARFAIARVLRSRRAPA